MTTKKILDFYASVETIITQLVKMIVSIFTFSIGEIAPLAAPIAPAFSVFKALNERLETPVYIALAGAIAIELVGIFISKTAIHCHNWNSTRIKTEPEAPRSLAIAIAALFFLVVFILSLTIEIDPDLAILVYPGFVLIAITTYTALAVSNNLQAWERDRGERLSDQAEKRGLAADIRQAKTDLESILAKAKNEAADLEKLAAQRAKLAADIQRHEAELTRLAEANGPLNKRKITPVSGQTYAEKMELIDLANATKQAQIEARHNVIIDLKQNEPTLTQPGLTDRLNELGFNVSLSTVKRDLKQLNGSVAR